MNGSDNDFQALRQLLALKRHEIPPPGYFEGFAGEVTSRLRSGESIEHAGVGEKLASEAPWLFKFLELFDAKPAIIGGFATALCGLLLFGIVLAERPDVAPQTSQLFSETAPSIPQVAASAATPSTEPNQPMLALNTNSSLQPITSPVFGSQNSLFQMASYSSGN